MRSLDGRVEITHRPKILRNLARCRACGDTIESTHRHDFRRCTCGSIAVDGGQEYLRRVGDLRNFEELSTYEPD